MKGRIGLLILILIIAAILALDARAQDAPTDVGPWQTQIAIDTAAMTATAAPPAPEPEPVPRDPVAEGDLIVITWQGLAALIAVVLSAGLGVGGGGALLIIRSARQNEAITYAMERLFLSTPPATQDQIRRIVELIVEGGGLLDEVTDGQLPGDRQAPAPPARDRPMWQQFTVTDP